MVTRMVEKINHCNQFSQVTTPNQQLAPMKKYSSLEIFGALHELVHLFKARMLERLHARHPELSFMEMRLLMLSGQKPGVTQKELVERSHLDKGQMTRTLAGLQAQGWLERTADEHDKRIRCLFLSAKGQRLSWQLQQWHEEIANELFGDWPAEVVAFLVSTVTSGKR